MIINLQPDQVPLFWDLIKHSLIHARGIPKPYQQDYALVALEHSLLGDYQCWLSFDLDKDDNKILHCILVTSIINERIYGRRVLYVEALYGFRLISMEMMEDIYDGLKKFGLANDCVALVADYTNKRSKEFLMHLGFEEHSTTCRKFFEEANHE